jgi:DNA-binding MarR family transcriptional regulator
MAMQDSPGTTQKRRFDSVEQEAFLNLWRTYDKLKELEEALFTSVELSAQQYNTLRLLRASHPVPIPTLSLGARLISRAPDMTRLLDKLESRNLIQRARREDNRRVVNVSLTQAGLDLLDQLAEPVRMCHEQQLGHLSADELNSLIHLLKKARAPHENRNNLSIADE